MKGEERRGEERRGEGRREEERRGEERRAEQRRGEERRGEDEYLRVRGVISEVLRRDVKLKREKYKDQPISRTERT